MEMIYVQKGKSIKLEFRSNRNCFANYWNYDVWEGKYARIKKNLHVCFQIIRANNSNHAFFMKSNGLKEEHYFIEMSANDTQMRIEGVTWGHKCFVVLFSFYLETEILFCNISFSRGSSAYFIDKFEGVLFQCINAYIINCSKNLSSRKSAQKNRKLCFIYYGRDV